MTVTRKARRHAWLRLPLIIWLAVVWVLLWGTLDVPTAVAGLTVAIVVVVAFPMPAIATRLRLRPLRLLYLLVWVLADLLTSALQVAWESVRFGPRTKAAIISVPVPSDIDHVVVAAANLVSLGPGKFVLQIDRAQRVFYVYALGLRDSSHLAKVRGEVLALQRLVILALGSDEDVAAMQASTSAQPAESKPAGSKPAAPKPAESGATGTSASESTAEPRPDGGSEPGPADREDG
ncbi:Na+/H+ antiporter subunit E [Actinoalloteichus hymeniacidonis]|uniref:Multisubunit Na+/H+ antiporter, MnhE subunit n=1 Tax=Actinoalloteichus hymeniacidonis TaxID=340345 RepID=A0AAC9HTU6_9PSEU|nr:Na+/H+ antiporter subunit E [Actinoalloteichus hymeniacidonis]AOS65577.1 multisubunit Na+/H+ antiporter, MnhE subunit [Actinoalloteichus hymeniacidonis]MBB5906333.1 multicomponent Na+:H+ antiporter subunit E [Actinoalloteichus hymeniacidonis]